MLEWIRSHLQPYLPIWLRGRRIYFRSDRVRCRTRECNELLLAAFEVLLRDPGVRERSLSLEDVHSLVAQLLRDAPRRRHAKVRDRFLQFVDRLAMQKSVLHVNGVRVDILRRGESVVVRRLDAQTETSYTGT